MKLLFLFWLLIQSPVPELKRSFTVIEYNAIMRGPAELLWLQVEKCHAPDAKNPDGYINKFETLLTKYDAHGQIDGQIILGVIPDDVIYWDWSMLQEKFGKLHKGDKIYIQSYWCRTTLWYKLTPGE